MHLGHRTRFEFATAPEHLTTRESVFDFTVSRPAFASFTDPKGWRVKLVIEPEFIQFNELGLLYFSLLKFLIESQSYLLDFRTKAILCASTNMCFVIILMKFSPCAQI